MTTPGPTPLAPAPEVSALSGAAEAATTPRSPAWLDSLQLGRVPRVVGTIITSEFLAQWAAQPVPLPCDLVELRLDGFPQYADWPAIGRQIEAAGWPVFATVRLAAEGGHWAGSDAARWPWLERSLRALSGIDIELESELLPRAIALGRELGKLTIVSHHDFRQTPPLPRLHEIITRAQAAGSIAKLAATAHSAEDLDRLRSLLATHAQRPICVIGMGQLGRESRLQFPKLGSCFSYGYLDTPGAPGQYSAAELRQHFGTA